MMERERAGAETGTAPIPCSLSPPPPPLPSPSPSFYLGMRGSQPQSEVQGVCGNCEGEGVWGDAGGARGVKYVGQEAFDMRCGCGKKR